MVAPIEQRFNAAVNVIRSLPKHGSYQPSNDMMLRFYAYFKQATLGPCTQQRPAFWNVVEKAKWDAYKALGNMPAERAMELYVDELKKIIETMSYTDNVAHFMGSVDQLNAVDIDDLEAIAPDAIQKVRSRPNSPFASRESSPVRVAETAATATASFPNGGAALAVQEATTGWPPLGGSANNSINSGYHSDEFTNGHSTTDHSDDEYIDTVEDDTILHSEPIHHRYSRSTSRRMDNFRLELDQHDPSVGLVELLDSHTTGPSGHTANHNGGNANGNTSTQHSSGGTGNTTMHVVSANVEPALHQMLRCVELMRVDLQQINNRISIVERSLADVRQQQLQLHRIGGSTGAGGGGGGNGGAAAGKQAANVCGVGDGRSRLVPAWWPFGGITPVWFLVMAVVWPLVARRLVRVMQHAASSGSRRR